MKIDPKKFERLVSRVKRAHALCNGLDLEQRKLDALRESASEESRAAHHALAAYLNSCAGHRITL